MNRKNQLQEIDFSHQAASDLIKDFLIRPVPCMISRLGSAELSAILNYLDVKNNNSYLKKSGLFITGKIGPFWWDRKIIDALGNNAGFFPISENTLCKFAERMLADISEVDILGSWLQDESRLASYFSAAQKVRLKDLEPYYHENPWSEALKDRNVLVIHPFEESIKLQYEKRELLFRDHRVLPSFRLQTLKAVQSIAGNNVDFESWFAALDWMCEKISLLDYEVAIVGAGAYGLPLAAFVKTQGKKAIHLGGATQILFGVRGKRWDNIPFFNELYNKYWIKPLPIDTPLNVHVVEGGCYW